MKRLAFFTLILLFVAIIAHMATGQVAKRQVIQDARYLEYEGVLTGTAGEKLTGEYLMMFHVYDTKTSGSPLWEENHRVTVTDGEFRVTLGKKSRLPISDERSYYIGITINEDELSPRQPITVREGSAMDDPYVVSPPVTVPYGAGGGWTDDGTVVRLTTVSDSVGIGTSTPTTVFEVQGADTSSSAVALVKNTEGGFGLRAESLGSYSTASHFGVFAGAEGPGPASVGSMGAAVNSGAGMAYGNYGVASNTGSGFAYGSYGVASNPGLGWAYGVHGLGENTSEGLAFGGLFSTTDSGTGAHYGVQALSFGTSTSPMVGVHGFGQNNAGGEAYGGFFEAPDFGTGHHYGIWSDAVGSSLWTYGIYSNAVNSGSGHAYAGYFLAGGDGSGVNYGVFANSTSTSPVQTTGVYGHAVNHGSGPVKGGSFSAGSTGTGVHYGVYGSEAAGGSGAAVYAEGDMIASGAKPAVVKTSSGHRLLYAQESPEVWFEDFGEGQLKNGRTHIELDPLFLETVTIDEMNPMQVFVQLTSGEPMPTVVERGIAGFEVRVSDKESYASFSYRVVAKRKGYEDERLRETDVGYEDPNLYPELLAEIEREHEERRQRQELERQRMEEQSQQIQEQQRRMEQARLGEVGR